jgi:hypothetical protein
MNPPLSSVIVGTWQLESRTDRTQSGEHRIEPSLGDDPIALLYYDAAGHFAAQFMKRHREERGADAVSAGSNNTRAIGGYDAYFGTYTVDDRTGTVTQTLVGALGPENVGHVVSREMHVTDGRLTIVLETSAPDGERLTRTLIWKRVG